MSGPKVYLGRDSPSKAFAPAGKKRAEIQSEWVLYVAAATSGMPAPALGWKLLEKF